MTTIGSSTGVPNSEQVKKNSPKPNPNSMYTAEDYKAANLFRAQIDSDGNNIVSADEQRIYLEKFVKNIYHNGINKNTIKPPENSIKRDLDMYDNKFNDIDLSQYSGDDVITALTNILGTIKAKANAAITRLFGKGVTVTSTEKDAVTGEEYATRIKDNETGKYSSVNQPIDQSTRPIDPEIGTCYGPSAITLPNES